MANQVLQSNNFTINFDPVVLPKSQQQANALFAVVENEFDELTGWFGVSGGFGPGNRVIINFVASLPSGGANNFGYQSDGTTTINLISRETDPSATNAAAVTKMYFVAEFVEVLMGYRNTQGPETWNAGYSHGEGLSLLCAFLRYPTAYQSNWPTPWVDSWLQLPGRNAASHDWITNVNQTDSDPESFGCSLLFLLYLKIQLHYSVQEIIQKGGSTLELTYKNLTNQTNAITAFRNLIDPYFPVGNTPILATENPFPLLTGWQRDVNIQPQSAPNGTPYIVLSDSADVELGIFCPEKKPYHFDIYSTPQVLTCVATVRGFGQPVYRWRVNGVDVPGSGPITATASVTLDDPTVTSQIVTKTITVPVQCVVTPSTFTSTLTLTFNSTVAHIHLVIEALAKEKFASTDEQSGIEFVTVDNEKIAWEAQYYKDRAECKKRWDEFINAYVEVDPFFNILHTLPDPPPDGYRRFIQELGQISLAITRLRERSPEDARTMEQAVDRAYGIDSAILYDIGRLARIRDQETILE